MQIDPGSNIQHYLNRLRQTTDPEDLRTSPRRADHLSRVGAILAMEDVYVRLDPGQPTATINTDTRPGRSPRDRWEISITSKELPQPVTSYTREAYDLLAQETLLVHEIGHALFTDYETFEGAVERVAPEHEAGFRVLFNAAEDVAIEEQLRAQFSVAEEIDTLNANLFEAIVPDQHEYTLLQAAELAILELGVWETGRLKGLLDPNATGRHAHGLRFRSDRDERLFKEEVFPLVRELVKEMKTTASGAERIDRLCVFWDAFRDVLDAADSDGDDGAADSPMQGVKPDDADPARRGENRDADALDDADPSAVDDRADDALGEGDDAGEGEDEDDAGGGPGGQDADDAAGEDGAGGEPAGDDQPEGDPDDDGFGDVGAEGAFSVDLRDTEPRPGDDAGEPADGADGDAEPDPGGADADDLEGGSPGGSVSTNADIEENYAEEARADARSVADDNETMADELEEMMTALEGANDEFAGVQLDVPLEAGGGRYDEDSFEYAHRVSQWIAQELGDRLRIEKRQRPIRRRTTGGLDSKRMMAWDRGDHRIFKRTQEGGDKDYHAMFVADRSSSMGGAKIRMLERSIGGMAMGLEEIGVDVAVMDLYRDEARLVKPFGVSVESRRPLMFSQDSSGGTPLSKVIAVARERLDAVGGNRFLVIVTDGQVGEAETFKDQVDRCNFPVLGIYLAPGYRSLEELTYFNSKYDYEGQLALFHRYRTVFDQNGLDRTLQELCKEVMF